MDKDSAVPECVAHQMITDEDCEYCKAEIEAMEKKYDKVVKNNLIVEQDLRTRGINIPQIEFLNLKLNMLVQSLAGHDVKQITRFELNYVNVCSNLLMEAEKNTRITVAKSFNAHPSNTRGNNAR